MKLEKPLVETRRLITKSAYAALNKTSKQSIDYKVRQDKVDTLKIHGTELIYLNDEELKEVENAGE